MIEPVSLGAMDLLVVIIAAVLTFPLGYLWYSDFLFGKSWRKEQGIKDTKGGADMSGMPFIMAISMLLTFISAVVLAMLLGHDAGAFKGGMLGAMIAIAFVATSFGITYMYEKKSLDFFLINAGYNLASFILMGIIIGLFI